MDFIKLQDRLRVDLAEAPLLLCEAVAQSTSVFVLESKSFSSSAYVMGLSHA